MTEKELNKLIKGFKELAELDIVGITTSDARNIVSQWLVDIGQLGHARKFTDKVLTYQNSKKLDKMRIAYDKQERGW